MGVFVKLACLAVVLGGGSLLMLWLLIGGHVALAWLALAGTAALSGAVIVLITLGTRRVDRTPDEAVVSPLIADRSIRQLADEEE